MLGLLRCIRRGYAIERHDELMNDRRWSKESERKTREKSSQNIHENERNKCRRVLMRDCEEEEEWKERL